MTDNTSGVSGNAAQAEAMNEPVQPKLPNQKQLIGLSQLILVVTLGALLFRIRIIESEIARDEFRSLLSLQTLTTSPLHAALMSEDEFSMISHLAVQPAVADFLSREHSDLNEKRINARTAVSDWLVNAGVPKAEVGAATGKGRGDSLPFVFFHSELDRSSFVPSRGEPASSRRQAGGFDAFDAPTSDDGQTGSLLDELAFWGQHESIDVVSAIDPTAFPRIDFHIVSGDRGQGGPPFAFGGGLVDVGGGPERGQENGRYRLFSVQLASPDSLTVTFLEVVPPQVQQKPIQKELQIPVTTTSVKRRWSQLISSQHNDPRLDELAVERNRAARLSQKYGLIQIEQAVDLTSKRMLETYGDVKLLGFDFAPDSFWLVVAGLLLLFQCSLALQLRHPVEEGKPEVSLLGLHVLLQSTSIRTALWTAVPLAALLLVMPASSSGCGVVVCYWTATGIVILGGISLSRLSTQIERRR